MARASVSPVLSRVLSTIVLFPRNVAVVVLRLYRAVISPLYGDVCRYYPSCSHYALTAIQQHGLVIGSVLAARRLLRCHPWAAGGVDDVPARTALRWPSPGRRPNYVTTRFGFVVAGPGKD